LGQPIDMDGLSPPDMVVSSLPGHQPDHLFAPFGCAFPRHSFAVSRAPQPKRTALAVPAGDRAWLSVPHAPGPRGRSLPAGSEHTVKCVRIRLAVSCPPQPQPRFICGPRGGARLTRLPPSAVHGVRAADSFGYMVKCARIRRPVSAAPQRQPHGIRGPGGCPRGCPRLAFGILPRWAHVVRRCRPLRAYGEVCAHIAPGKLVAAALTAFHPRPSRLAKEIACRVPPIFY
jgi:hypothetical protein